MSPAKKPNPASDGPPGIVAMLLDNEVPDVMRRALLADLCGRDEAESRRAIDWLLRAAATGGGAEARYAAMCRELEATLEQWKAGPLRSALLLATVSTPGQIRRAKVLLGDGSPAYCAFPDDELAARLRRGDAVWLEAQGRAVLFGDEAAQSLGEEATLLRRVDSERVEVELAERGRAVFLATARLLDQFESGEAVPGASILICPSRRLAFATVPDAEGCSHLRYLVREPPPDVLVERDIGAPPEFLGELALQLESELLDPSVRRRYRLPRLQTRMLAGPTGTGKTLCIQAFWRLMYEVVARCLGVTLESLPPRVLRLRASQVLSEWLGRSEKNLDRFFDEVQEVAAQPLLLPDGREVELPVLVIIEECDGLARERGDEAIYDRIQTTLLQRLDAADGLRDKLVYVLCSTNVESLIDPAFLRRVGGRVVHFGRLDRRGFRAVLDRHLYRRPLAAALGTDPVAGRRRLSSELEGWLYSSNGFDHGLVELSFAGQSSPEIRRRRDFLTGALVELAVQQACDEACEAERLGVGEPGLDARGLLSALDGQIRALAQRLRPENVSQYLTVPDGARVLNVRRIEQPEFQPYELEVSG